MRKVLLKPKISVDKRLFLMERLTIPLMDFARRGFGYVWLVVSPRGMNRKVHTGDGSAFGGR